MRKLAILIILLRWPPSVAAADAMPKTLARSPTHKRLLRN